MDSYDKCSIKSQERKRRGQVEKFLEKGPSMKGPPDWKSFLANDENEEMLAKMILQVWSEDSFATNLKDRKVSENKIFNKVNNFYFCFRSH